MCLHEEEEKGSEQFKMTVEQRMAEFKKSLDEIHTDYIHKIKVLDKEYEDKKKALMNEFVADLQQFNGIILDESDSTKGENGK